jgi:hypothetical protein
MRPQGYDWPLRAAMTQKFRGRSENVHPMPLGREGLNLNLNDSKIAPFTTARDFYG